MRVQYTTKKNANELCCVVTSSLVFPVKWCKHCVLGNVILDWRKECALALVVRFTSVRSRDEAADHFMCVCCKFTNLCVVLLTVLVVR